MSLQRSRGRNIRKSRVPSITGRTRQQFRQDLESLGLVVVENTTNTSDNGLDQQALNQNISPDAVVPFGTTIAVNYYVYVYPGFSHYAGFYHGFYHGFGHYGGFYHGFYHGFGHYAGFYHGFYHGFAHYGGFYHTFYHGFNHGYGGFYHGFAHGYGGFYHSFAHGYGGFTHGGFRWYSIGSQTGVLTPEGAVSAENLKVGDKLLSLNISDIDFATFNPEEWSTADIEGANVVETEVVSISSRVTDTVVRINNELYSTSHWILAKINGVTSFVKSEEITTSHEVWNFVENGWVPVTEAATIAYIDKVYSINCEPYDMFFTSNMLVFDSDPNRQEN